MRSLAGIALLLFAAIDFFAGQFYLFAVFGMTGAFSILGSMFELLGAPAIMLSEIDQLGAIAAVLITLYGAFLFVSSFVIFIGGIALISERSRTLVIFAGGLCLTGELVSISLYGPAVFNVTGVIISLLAGWQAMQLNPASANAGQSRARPYSNREKALVVGLVFGLILFTGFLALHGMVKMHAFLGEAMKQAADSGELVVVRTDSTGSNRHTGSYVDPQPAGAVQGLVQGQQFTLQRATIKNDVLTLRQGNDFFADHSVTIFLFNDHTLPENQHFSVTRTSDEHSAPHIHLRWLSNKQDVPETFALTSQYELELEFGTALNGKLPGKIKLLIPGEQATELEGLFEATIK